MNEHDAVTEALLELVDSWESRRKGHPHYSANYKLWVARMRNASEAAQQALSAACVTDHRLDHASRYQIIPASLEEVA